MTLEQTRHLKHGVYRFYWVSGGVSLGVIGSMHNGGKWYNCANWTMDNTPDERGHVKTSVGQGLHGWEEVVHVELIES